MTEPRPLLVWLDSGRREHVHAAASAAGAHLAVVVASRPAESASLAHALGAEAAPDLRAALDVHGESVAAVWLAGAEPLERDVVDALARSRCPVVSSEPRPLRATALEEHAELARRLRVGPTLLDEPAWAGLLEMRADLGEIDVVRVRTESPVEDGTLLARVHEALQVGETLLGPVERVAAAWHGAATAPDRLADAVAPARLVILARAELGTLVVDAALAPARGRAIELAGPGGRIAWDGARLELRSADGATLDASDAPTTTPVEAAARMLRATLAAAPEPPRPDPVRILAAAEAARLASLTGDAERVDHVLRMVKA